MSEQIALTLAGGNGQYDLERAPLGGGQTALVYKATVRHSSVAARIGQTCAIKLMIPGLDRETERRFWNEEDYLLGLNSALKQMPLPALGRKNGEGLVPQIWDQGVDSGRGFLVMTLAEGKPLDDLLRSQEALSEMDALTLIYQLLAVFRALHEELRRGYHDFQPRNIFWRDEARTITVIDWNLLSPEQDAGQESPLYAQDRRIVLRLLYRLLVGVELPGPSPMQMAAPSGWAKLSPLTRLLLRELLAPPAVQDKKQQEEKQPSVSASKSLGPAVVDCLSTQALYERIGEALQRQRQSADELLLAAASQYEQVTQLTDQPDQAQVLTRIRLTQEASALLSLAEAKGISPRMGPIAQELRQNLGQESPSRAHLSSGLSFLGAGDRTLAREFFAKAVTEATLPEDQLAAWRWWLLTRAIPSQEKVEPLLAQLKPLLTNESGRPAQGETARGQLAQIEWPGLDQLVREMEIGQILQDLLHLDVRTLDEDPLKDWYIKSGQALGAAPQADSSQAEAKALDLQALGSDAYRVEGNSYADCLWMVLAQACGLRNATTAQQAATQQRSALMDRVRLLENLKRELSALDLGKALDMVAGRRETIDPYERTLHQYILQRIPDWFDGTESDPSVHDPDLHELFSWLENRGVQGEKVKPFRRLLGLFEAAAYWTRTVIPAHKETEQVGTLPEQGQSSTTQDTTLSPTDPPSESAESGQAGLQTTTPRSISPELALEYALSFLKEIEESVKEIEQKRKATDGKAEESQKKLPVAQKRREKLVDAFVDQCLRFHYISPLIKRWLEEYYPGYSKALANGLDYEKKIEEYVQKLAGLNQEIKKAEEKREQQRQKHEAELEKIRAERERTIAGLAARVKEQQTNLNKLDEEFKQEIARRELALKNQLADKQKALDGLAAEHARQKQALDSSLQSLQETLRQKREELTELDKLVKDLNTEKKQLESKVSEQQRLEDMARRNRAKYEEDIRKAAEELRKVHNDVRDKYSTLEKLTSEIKKLDQQRNLFPQQTSHDGRIIKNSDAPTATFQPLESNQGRSQQPDPRIIDDINVLLKAAIDLQNEPPDMSLPERMSNALCKQAIDFQYKFNQRMNQPIPAQDVLEKLRHICLILEYLDKTNDKTNPGSNVIYENQKKIWEIRDKAIFAFRKQWIKE